MRARRAKTIPRQIAPIAITAHPISAVVPKRASAEGAMKNPEPTMLPITRAVQVVSPRLRCPVDAFPVALHRDDLCVDVELLSPLGKPGFRGCPRQGREHPLLEDLSQRCAPARPVRRLPSLQHRLEALGAVLSQERPDAAREGRNREVDCPSLLQ